MLCLQSASDNEILIEFIPPLRLLRTYLKYQLGSLFLKYISENSNWLHERVHVRIAKLNATLTLTRNIHFTANSEIESINFWNFCLTIRKVMKIQRKKTDLFQST